MQEKPNIVFIMTDDQGPWAFGAAGDLNARTPNLDRLCKQGGRLTNYFGMSAVCSPSRACLITSRYSTEVGIPDFIPSKESNIGLDTSFPTWPSILTDAGYETALIGKWHLGSSDEHHPTCHGYQEFTGFRIGAGISKNPKVEVDGQLQQMKGYTPDILTDFAIEFIHRKRSDPFMLSLHFWAPHANTDCKTPEGDRTWHPLSDADWKPFKNMDPWIPNPDYPNLDIPRLKRMTCEYMASIASVDRNVGRLLDVLDKLKLSDNTLIVFTSDNGYNMGHNGIWHKGNGRWILTNNRGDRPNLYDNTLRLPAIVRWPGVISPNTVINETISNLDWFPTLTSIGGASSAGKYLIRGRNFLPLLRGISSEWNNDLFAQYSMWDWHQTGADLRTYRTTQWKLVRDFNCADKDELYNLVDDRHESHNLMENADITIRNIRDSLNDKLLESMQNISDPAIVHQIF